MPIYFSKSGLALAQQRAREQEERVRIVGAEAGAEAGPNCDWHDNFGYEDAKRRLELEARKLAEMREQIKDSVIIDLVDQHKVVAIGVTVEIEMDNLVKTYTIGAYNESDPSKGLISYSSPLASAILGHSIGDEIEAVVGTKKVDIYIVNTYPPSHRYENLMKEHYLLTPPKEELAK